MLGLCLGFKAQAQQPVSPELSQGAEWLQQNQEIQALLQKEDYESAIPLLLELISKESESTERSAFANYYYQLGLAYYNLKLYALALDAFESSLQRSLEIPPTLLFSLGMSYYYTRNLENAQEYLNRVIADPRSNSELIGLAENQLMLTLRDQSGVYQEGMKAYQEGRFSEASQYLTEALRFLPNSGELHYYLGASQIQTQNYDLARFHFQEVIRLEPGTELAQRAQLTLEVIEKLGKDQPQRPFYGSLNLGFTTDSNVNFGGPRDNNTSLPEGSNLNLSDGSLIFNLATGYQWFPELGLKYNLYTQQYLGFSSQTSQGLSSTDFSLILNSLSLSNRFALSDQLELSLNTQGDFEWLGKDPFLWDAYFRPSLTWYLTERLVTRANLALGGELYPQYSERDNLNHQIGFEQFIYLWNSQTWLRFSYDWFQVYARDQIQRREIEQGTTLFQVDFRFANSRVSHQLGLGFGFPVGPIQFEVGSRFDMIDYTQPEQVQQYVIRLNPLTGLQLPPQALTAGNIEKFRQDQRLNFYAQFDWPISRELKLQGRYTRTTNVSNITPDDYAISRSYLKDVLGLSLRYEF
ncbi:hypothetical protein COW36_19790 [bacterium (Candidatus Blackallbacteria) CG17_big_fil_post_rev_8_21_14_2_50_48_46]|uniref:Uncharacterized protein n=1 Tax=bacterium (Candidatus Blackallbacteria) CG17_big_fil_post_rev_8_21_14_2_50_48_46 TaxID=2014261 RepID=A0A2M7G008_9BACT|nr:MAG: hypothetical protein COW64_15505 [bacterium (Candidatus Blackallbacteria) CG18_big_fil_WC_8_21_14_2_50_49_26]PIW14893.1 MAG: hypothetical protein COW36_19790 [bacterium (Candidatus Blackallbacteria) CG17_big_fil_post_rev_8_21_14_2_50_48_46]PIW44319.1 MAG: hypothetical protein COW20_24570 [bacterium (Candidatus Blackallbacteria) CG13_big_fil_rev_8_21_14_2_50_49_14]